MIKVFLVEDEKIIRKSIKNNVKWEENGFEFAGEAPDGEMALPMIEKLHPDIVITDIKMPFMDGLELSDILKKKMPKIQIIILSGYGEFDYAKEAIKIGVTDYLTKPVTGEQLLEALNKVKQKLDKKKRQEEEIYQKMGLEWLYRTVKEPSRFKRIFPALPLFLIQVIIETVHENLVK